MKSKMSERREKMVAFQEASFPCSPNIENLSGHFFRMPFDLRENPIITFSLLSLPYAKLRFVIHGLWRSTNVGISHKHMRTFIVPCVLGQRI